MDPKLHLSAFCLLPAWSPVMREQLPRASVLREAKSTSAQLSSFMHTSVVASLAFTAAPLLFVLRRDQHFKKTQPKVLIAAKQISRTHFSQEEWFISCLMTSSSYRRTIREIPLMESSEEMIYRIYGRQRCKWAVLKGNYPEMVICPDIFQNSPLTICFTTPRVVAEQHSADGETNPQPL